MRSLKAVPASFLAEKRQGGFSVKTKHGFVSNLSDVVPLFWLDLPRVSDSSCDASDRADAGF